MPTTTVVQRTINAPTARVFAAVSEPAALPEVIPDIERVEFLTERRSGVGTRFRETRLVSGKPAETELEITELVPNQRVRMIADSHGTVWDSVFTVRRMGEKTELRIAMEARAHELLPKLLNPLFKGLYRKGLDKHVEAVKVYCEETDQPTTAADLLANRRRQGSHFSAEDLDRIDEHKRNDQPPVDKWTAD